MRRMLQGVLSLVSLGMAWEYIETNTAHNKQPASALSELLDSAMRPGQLDQNEVIRKDSLFGNIEEKDHTFHGDPSKEKRSPFKANHRFQGAPFPDRREKRRIDETQITEPRDGLSASSNNTINLQLYQSNVDPQRYFLQLETQIGSWQGLMLVSNDYNAIQTPSSECTTCTANVFYYYNNGDFQEITNTTITTPDVTMDVTVGYENSFCLNYGQFCNNSTGSNQTAIELVNNQTLTNTSFFINEFQLNGVIGFGRPNVSDPNAMSFTAQLYRDGAIQSTTWAYIPGYYYDYPYGYIEVGGYNPSSAVNGVIYWFDSPVNASQPDAWFTSFNSFMIDSNYTQNTALGQGVLTQAQFSTGYLGIGVDSATWMAVCLELQDFYNGMYDYYGYQYETVCNSTNATDGYIEVLYYGGYTQCPWYNQYFSLDFSFGTRQIFSLLGENFQWEFYDNSVYAYRCFIQVQDIGATSTILLGMPFIEQFFTVFDTDNNRVGIAPSSNSATYWYGPYIYVGPVEVPLESAFTSPVDYYMMAVNVDIGTPAQSGMFLLASDTSAIMTPSFNCTTCAPAKAFFNPSNSSTFNMNQSSFIESSTYLTTNSMLGNDVVCLGGSALGFCVDSTMITLVNSASWASGFVVDEFQLNGTFGLGRPNPYYFYTDNFIVGAYNSGLISSLVYSLEPNANITAPGDLLIGGYNDSNVYNLQWTSSDLDYSQPDSWFSGIYDMTINNQSVIISQAPSKAQLQTGYQHIGIDSTSWSEACSILASFNSTIACNNVLNSLPTGNGMCSQYPSPWNLTIQLSTQAIYMVSGESLKQQVFDGTSYKCYWNLQNIGSSSTWLLGEAFLRQFYVVFDSQYNEFGIGTSTNNANPENGPWIIWGPPLPIPTYFVSLIDIAQNNMTGNVTSCLPKYSYAVDWVLGWSYNLLVVSNDLEWLMTPSINCTNCSSYGAQPFYYQSWYGYQEAAYQTTTYSDQLTMNYDIYYDYDQPNYYYFYQMEYFTLVNSINFNSPLQASEFIYGGILGLGRPDFSAYGSTELSLNYLSQLYNQGYINSPIYSFEAAWYEETSNSFDFSGQQIAGDLAFGGYQQNITTTGRLAWVDSPVNSTWNQSWFVGVQAMTFMGSNIYSPSLTASAAFMTGYEQIGLPASIWTQVCNSLANFHRNPITKVTPVMCDGTIPYANQYCTVFNDTAWNLTVQFSTDKVFTMNGQSLRRQYNGNATSPCYWQFSNLGSTSQVVIGQAFIWQYYTSFDVTNQRIGFGTMAGNQYAAPLYGPWITTAGSPPSPKPVASTQVIPTYAGATWNDGFWPFAEYLFFVQVNIGNLAQSLNFMIANDMSDIWVKSYDQWAQQLLQGDFQPWLSWSLQSNLTNQTLNTPGYSMDYIAMSDLVCLGGSGIYYGSICQNFDFKYINSIQYNTLTANLTSEYTLNGVIGMGRPNISDPNSQGFLAKAYRAGLIPSTTWAIINNPDYEWTANIAFGSYDASILNSDIYWVSSPVNSSMPDAWLANLRNLNFNQASVLGQYSDANAAFKTGYTFIGLPTPIWQNVVNQLNSVYSGQLVFNESLPYLNGACENFTSSWNISFAFGGNWDLFILSQEFLMTTHYQYSGWPYYYYSERCYIYIEDIGVTNDVVLGEVFFMQYFTVFDSDNQRIGFANHASNSSMIEQFGPWFSTHLSPSAPQNFTIPLDTINSFIYMTDVSIGNPPQEGQFLLASDSETIMTPSLTCTTCSPATAFFNSTLSEDYVQVASNQISSNTQMSMNFNVGSDVVCLGGPNLISPLEGFCIQNINFMIVNSMSWTVTPIMNEFQANGMFGLGRPDATNMQSQSFLAIAKQQNYINSVTYAYEPNVNYKLSGSLVVGGYDPNQAVFNQWFQSNIQWIASPINSANPDAWFTGIQSITLTGTPSLSGAPINISGQAEFVTGYQFIGLPDSIYSNVCNQISTAYANQGSISCTGSSPIGQSACFVFTQALNFTMRFSTDALFSMSIQSFAHDTTINGKAACMWSFQNIGTQSTVMVGQPFLGQFYSVFHVENQQVGFGVSVNQPNTSYLGPWITGYIYPPTPATYDFGLEQVQNLVFVVDVFIGNPAQHGQFIIANDQEAFLTPSMSCVGCNTAIAFYDPSQSSTWVQTGTQTYSGVSNSWTAVTGMDKVCLGGMSTDSITHTSLCANFTGFALAETYSNGTGFIANEFVFNGMIGLGRPNVNTANSVNLLQFMYKGNYINQMVWANVPNSIYNLAGTMQFGGYDSSQIVNNTLQWLSSPVDTTQPDSWILGVSGMTMNGTSIPNTSLNAKVVTGYQYIGLNMQAWSNLCQQMDRMNPGVGISCQNQTNAVPFVVGFQSCDQYVSNWNFTVQFTNSSQTFIISGRNFTVQQNFNGFIFCSWNIQNIGNTDYSILGDQFLKQFFTIFDVDNAKVGIGISTTSLNTPIDGPWITSQPQPDPNPSPSPSPSPSGTSALAIVGITVGSLVVVGVIVLGVMYYLKKKKNANANDYDNDNLIN